MGSVIHSVALILVVCCLSAFASHVYDWEKVEPAKGDETLTFYVALHQRNIDVLEVCLIILLSYLSLFIMFTIDI